MVSCSISKYDYSTVTFLLLFSHPFCCSPMLSILAAAQSYAKYRASMSYAVDNRALGNAVALDAHADNLHSGVTQFKAAVDNVQYHAPAPPSGQRQLEAEVSKQAHIVRVIKNLANNQRAHASTN